ncbi:unnamed protein product [Mytilus edulis]|uniref:Cytochrome P450 n=1 Tax=Mytilus edulis TaxID=6550 RepID=A0A8S3UVC7_MYTED|nr:unnamed protein product [Mytilus edulis]
MLPRRTSCKQLGHLRQNYGDIISLSLGSYWVVFVNGRKFEELFVKHANETSDRPMLFIFKLVKIKSTERLDENNIRDFIDAYFLKTVETNNEYYTDEQLLSVIADLFGAGTETSATTIEWAFVYMMNDMDIQIKMRQEIDDIAGNGRLPTLSDKHNLLTVKLSLLRLLDLEM